MRILQTVIFLYPHSRQFIYSKFVWCPKNHGELLPFVTFFERQYSEKAMNNFIEGRQVSLTFQWEPKNFSPSERKKSFNYAIENLKSALNIDTKQTPSSVSNKNMKPIILQALETQDLSIVEDKLKWCLESNKYPSFDILKALAVISVESENPLCVDTIRNVVRAGYPSNYLKHAQLLLYATEVSWRNGDFADSLMFLTKLFEECPFAKSYGRFLLSRIIAEAVNNRVEPPLILLINFAESLIDHEDDYFPMTVIWYYLFTSEYFVDQEKAEELIRKYENLKNQLSYLVEYVSYKLLKLNQKEDVLRLLEFLLRHKLHSQYISVQQHLFNYHYQRRNIKACTEIYKSSVTINLPLSEHHRNMYMNLILEFDDSTFQKQTKPESIELKF